MYERKKEREREREKEEIDIGDGPTDCERIIIWSRIKNPTG